jgi:beta-galactosidase/beta-glucuronidase
MSAPVHGYPRPQLRRPEWFSLNGPWDFAIDADAAATGPGEVAWTQVIQVPFAPETPASGVQDNGLFRACWYRRIVDVPPLQPGQRLLLHFGAVDHRATVWVNGSRLGHHEGGYTPFTFDITDDVGGRPRCEIVVRAEDDPSDLSKPRGKQDWEPVPHSIWYPRTTGIWQTVWLERAPETRIHRVRWTPNLERWEIDCAVECVGPHVAGLTLRVRLHSRDQLLADDRYLMVKDEVHRRIALSDPGIDDFRNHLLWSPSSPSLIDADLQLITASGTVVDDVASYTALRSIATEGDRFTLNGRPYYLRLVLDQGYWPQSGLTPPDDDALRQDVVLAKAMGFNGVRKHQKVEDPRYLYWADQLGLVVWAEMPSCYRFTRESIHRASREWMDVIMRDSSHPCVCAWVPFNESWGVPNLPMNVTERHYVHALYHLTKTLDPTRPVIGNDGWESVATDIIGIHDYDPSPQRLASRYGAEPSRPRLFKYERPAGRALVLQGDQHGDEQPIMLTEFGGISLTNLKGGWGYSRSESADELATHYRALISAVHAIPLFAGFCYTQFADTYQEANGLLYGDRTPKFPLRDIAEATVGTRLGSG